MKVPFIDLPAQCKAIKSEVMSVFEKAVDSGGFIGGPNVSGFEEEFANFCQTKYCVGVGSGTDALRLALLAADIGPGDEVITVPNTFIATTEAISQTGAKIGFVDIDPKTYNMDPQKLEDYLKIRNLKSAIRNRPKAIIPIHLYGQPADMDPILEIAERYNLLVIEDACQAHGAEYKGKRAGSMGLAGCFSFYPGKNLGAFGEAGAVVTNSDAIAEKVRMLRDHGQMKKYCHQIEGYNARLDAIQAGVLRVKLKYMLEWNEKRRKNAHYYSELLSEVPGIVTPFEPSWSKNVYHLYVIRIKERDALSNVLNEKGIATGLHYPIPLHLQQAYKYLGYNRSDFPVTEQIAEEILSLPMFPELLKEQIEFVANSIEAFLSDNR